MPLNPIVKILETDEIWFSKLKNQVLEKSQKIEFIRNVAFKKNTTMNLYFFDFTVVYVDRKDATRLKDIRFEMDKKRELSFNLPVYENEVVNTSYAKSKLIDKEGEKLKEKFKVDYIFDIEQKGRVFFVFVDLDVNKVADCFMEILSLILYDSKH